MKKLTDIFPSLKPYKNWILYIITFIISFSIFGGIEFISMSLFKTHIIYADWLMISILVPFSYILGYERKKKEEKVNKNE